MPEIEPQNDTYELYGRTITLPNGVIVDRVDTPSFGENGTLAIALSVIREQNLTQPTITE